MKAGRVVSIRVNPRDCLAAIDTLEKIGLRVKGMSFAQVVSLAFSSAMESFRQNGIVPDRDGFEFIEMMQQFPADSRKGRAIAITKAFQLGETRVTAAAPLPRALQQAQQRLEELTLKAEADPINVSDEDRGEMLVLMQKLNPQLEVGEPTR